MLWILGVKTEVIGREHIPSGKNRYPVVLMSNHQHNVDGLLVSTVFHWTYTIIGKKSINISASFGVVQVDITKNIDDNINHADIALYEAKRSGRNKVIAYSQ